MVLPVNLGFFYVYSCGINRAGTMIYWHITIFPHVFDFNFLFGAKQNITSRFSFILINLKNANDWNGTDVNKDFRATRHATTHNFEFLLVTSNKCYVYIYIRFNLKFAFSILKLPRSAVYRVLKNFKKRLSVDRAPGSGKEERFYLQDIGQKSHDLLFKESRNLKSFSCYVNTIS